MELCVTLPNCAGVTFVSPRNCHLKSGGWTVSTDGSSAHMVSVDVKCVKQSGMFSAKAICRSVL